MKIPKFFKDNIEESEKENFKKTLITDNIKKGRILAIIMTGFEVIFLLTGIITAILKVDSRFHFNEYLVMYTIFILINGFYLLYIKKFGSLTDISTAQLKRLEIVMLVYMTLIMSWGSVISLMDQKIYGQLIVFMINMIICSVLYFFDRNKMIFPYIISTAILFVGLPFFQSSKDILVGHYFNVSVFIFISWNASRIVYVFYCNDFMSRALLQKSKAIIEKEIVENIDINNKLAIANQQLKKLALIDELTGIPNRRSFRNFIDIAFESYVKPDSVLSFLIIDVDFFKQYNDNYGHENGDKLIAIVANQVNSFLRNSKEFFVRWGGDEFVYVIFDTNEEDVSNLSEIIRQKVLALKIHNEVSIPNRYISVSIGTCTIKINGKEDVSKGIELADKALYIAKSSGRNCVKNMNENYLHDEGASRHLQIKSSV